MTTAYANLLRKDKKPSRIPSAGPGVRALNPHLYGNITVPVIGGGTVMMVNDIPHGKRIRQSSKPKMNKLEAQWAAMLTTLHPGVAFRAQAWRVELAEGLWYKVDFIGPTEGRWTAYEVKGPKSFRGGFENLKSAARLWPEIDWILVWKEKGEWRKQIVKA